VKTVVSYLVLQSIPLVQNVIRSLIMQGNINGAIKASGIVALLIVLPPMLIAMTYDEYPKYCNQTILLPCIGVSDE
tara:strand:+ start:1114 stop:1341 length:228 start_codon:yes stop_codon:yes gene_type:complete